MFSKQKVMISGRERGYAVRSLNCKLKSIYERFLLKKEFRSLKSWISGDASAIPVLRGFVSSVHFDDRNVKKRLCSAFEHAFEKHIHKVVELDILTTRNLSGTYVDTSSLDEKYDCLGYTSEKPQPKVNQPSLANFRKLLIYQFIMGMSIAFGILLFEFAISMVKQFVQQNHLKKVELVRLSSSIHKHLTIYWPYSNYRHWLQVSKALK